MPYDVIIIGAGAAGLLAAARAAERGRRTLLLEKNAKPGVKILMSGGTRCNITQSTDVAGIVKAYGKPGRFLYSALAALGPAELVDLIEAEGVATKVEQTGKVFPVSDSAVDVQQAFLRRLERSNAELALREPVESITHSNDEDFVVTTNQRKLVVKSIVITTGGQSYSDCGTTGDGYAWAKALGHTIITPRPALVPISSGETWIADLQGVTIPDGEIRVVDPAIGRRKPLDVRRGSFLLTHFGLSGPAVLDASRAVTGHHAPKTLCLEVDFLPMFARAELAARLETQLKHDGRKQIANVHLEETPVRLWQTMLVRAHIDPQLRAAEVDKKSRGKLVELLKATNISIAGTRGFKKAEVTAGGIDLREVNSSTMESKLVPGLYFAGEILDLDGPIGGYNFQAAFSTGWLAGESV